MAYLKPTLVLCVALLLGVTTGLPMASHGTALVKLRGGPSGSPVTPPDGTEVLNLGGTGAIHVEYQGVEGTTADGNTYRTMGIDLAQGFKPNPITGVFISGYFTPPAGYCGAFNLVIVEHQYIYQEVISFQAAAPLITIQCGPIQ
ncbi:hypothetical protein CALVIDRAFT_561538 [Calocera viscosa TUFC12733]|uniref:Lytic polysaccharide monooxygenase n=1 Tax=Calocera viscosa (strain TUFC12733) TaxID=1330018 RepID=A0A167PUI0_CALVF|nr:hypothetical protein CALVIDRAFT_561538 [Calocera viscosa TUFC12733]